MTQRKTPQNVDEMATLLIRSGLASGCEVADLHDRFRRDCFESGMSQDRLAAFCNLLVSVSALTRWQCDKLRNGQWKGFFLDGYELLGPAGYDESWTYLEARRGRIGAVVRLAIAPNPDNGPIVYRLVQESAEQKSG